MHVIKNYYEVFVVVVAVVVVIIIKHIHKYYMYIRRKKEGKSFISERVKESRKYIIIIK